MPCYPLPHVSSWWDLGVMGKQSDDVITRCQKLEQLSSQWQSQRNRCCREVEGFKIKDEAEEGGGESKEGLELERKTSREKEKGKCQNRMRGGGRSTWIGVMSKGGPKPGRANWERRSREGGATTKEEAEEWGQWGDGIPFLCITTLLVRLLLFRQMPSTIYTLKCMQEACHELNGNEQKYCPCFRMMMSEFSFKHRCFEKRQDLVTQ